MLDKRSEAKRGVGLATLRQAAAGVFVLAIAAQVWEDGSFWVSEVAS